MKDKVREADANPLHRAHYLTLISAYTPTLTYVQDQREMCYLDLNNLL